MTRKGKFSYVNKDMHRTTTWRRNVKARRLLEILRAAQDAQRMNTAPTVGHIAGNVSNQAQAQEFQQDERPTASYLFENVSAPSCSTEEMEVPVNEERQPEAESATTLFDVDKFNESASVFSIAQEYTQTLCPCTKLTTIDIVLMVLATGMRHKLTWLAQLDILKIIQSTFPMQKIPLSKHKLFKRVAKDTVDVKYHVFCPDCEAYLKPRNNLENKVKCNFCDKEVEVKKAANYFCSLSVRDQLRDLFQGPEDMGQQMVEYRAKRKKKNPSHLEDIFDGSQYKLQCQPGFILSNPNNFSYNFFTDGVPMGHSGKSIWPIYLMINELPEKIRTKYALLGGLYVGPKEPNLNVFMKPFVEEANKLSSEGFSWCLNGVDVVSKAIPMCAIADSPARCKLMNMQSHAAYWGCTFCHHKQQRTDTSSKIKFLIRCGVEERTLDSISEDINVASELQGLPDKTDRQSRGVYGPSSVAELNHFDISKNVTVDYMHCLLLGAVRSHTNCLFESEFKEVFWNLDGPANQLKMEDIIALIDTRLLAIKPPKSITRPPQSLSKRGSWKASEWRSWILFYCIVCLQGILKDKYLVHFAKLSAAIYILLQDSVSVEEVHEAHALLISYQCDYQEYFGQSKMVYNIHLLRHVCKGVLRFGPLWTHSSFPYEGQNRHTLQLLTSPYSVVKQIVKRYLLNKSFPNLCVSLTSNDSTIEFCEDTLVRHLKVYVYTSGCYLLGKGSKVDLTGEESSCLSSYGNYEEYWAKSVFHKRMLMKGFRVYALGCTEVKDTKNIDNYVTVEGVGISVVEKIILTPDSKVLVLVRPVIVVPRPILSGQANTVKLDHVKQVHVFGGLKCIYPGQITSQCVLMDLGVLKYVSNFPYGCYRD